MKKVYDEASKQITGEQEVHARHILVETEDEAKAIEAELKKGADFAELAKKKSKDPGASDGGDLGFFTKDQMVPEFSAVAFTLEPGQDLRSGEDRSSAGTSSRSRKSATARRPTSTRSRARSRPM